jgi:hypothetical protein
MLQGFGISFKKSKICEVGKFFKKIFLAFRKISEERVFSATVMLSDVLFLRPMF